MKFLKENLKDNLINFLKYLKYYSKKALIRKIILLLIDSIIIFLSFLICSFLISEFNFFQITLNYIPLYLLLILPIYIFTSQYKNLSRYAGVDDFYKIIFRNILVFFVFISIDFIFSLQININFYMLVYIFICIISGIVRFSIRDFILRFNRNKSFKSNLKNVIIYGAGSTAAQLARILKKEKIYNILAFIDESPYLSGLNINDIPIINLNNVSDFKGRVDKILLADSKIIRSLKLKIINKLRPLNSPVFEIPSLNKFLTGQISIDSLKPISIEDLLGREPLKPKNELLGPGISGKIILVTGAGGTIGEGLCRRLMELKPKKLIILDISEYALYKTHQMLLDLNISLEIIPILGDCCNVKFLEQLFDKYKINTIFHAAAYKHVPLVELNPINAISNNILSTKSICQVALSHAVDNLVFISTDKAVRPTNIMGASKRLAEIIVFAYSQKALSIVDNNEGNLTRYSMVRFGNVLGSSGSVVPLFLKQIKEGGPITLTHEKVIRYFMTIEEACLLVLQSLALARGGDLFLLDMGEPVSISHLASQMVLLSGLSIKDKSNPDGDIEIITTGLRPGEKLYEELLIEGECLKTKHPLIFTSNENTKVPINFSNNLKVLEDLLRNHNEEKVLEMLKEFVPEWTRFKKN